MAKRVDADGSKFDLVVYGASGFTGQFVVKELLKHSSERDVTWAVAGRSRAKLTKILHSIELETGR